MTARTCDDWPHLMELAPELQFKHYRASEVGLPAGALIQLPDVALADVDICCDLERHVFNRDHTNSQVASALAETDWQELRTWTDRDTAAS